MPTNKARSRCNQLQEQFLLCYLECGGVKMHAAKKMGICYNTITTWFTKKYFRERFKELEKMYDEALEEVARRRALVKSDSLLMFLMEAKNPQMYDKNYRKLKWEKEVAEEMQKKFPLPRIEIVSSAPLDKPINTNDSDE